ncbi:MAG TPA: glycerol-3-phosphate responsive antiterminator [Candidatus Blautia stercoripullorum]|uniref:Glycerol-3-phosphate responsive antiterminator n=1 Tax=Candidatus Blautia stercoripullorum TaxID=2838502 RepID=A0A9D2R9T7_9FIRM|nr:glycerol-3-phosphate responsive antiterminator [Candidatus Blautia stercoripullorum]
MDRRILETFEDCPVIAAIKDEEGLRKCLESDIPIVFVLYGDICNIHDIVGRLKQAGKIVIIHLDLVTGLSSKEIAVTYLHAVTHGDGIISTKPGIIRKAKEEGMLAIMRFFVIDSIAFESIQKQVENVHPDMIEILPGLMPKVIKKICGKSHIPVIAGGLITDKEDIMAALGAGAISISTTNQKVWFM